VFDANGELVAGVHIHDADRAIVVSTPLSNGLRTLGLLATTDSRGEFASANLPSGPLTLFAQRDGHRSASVSIGERATDIELVLPSVATHRSWIRVRLLDDYGAPVPDAKIRWARRAYLPEGTPRDAFGVAALPPMELTPGASGGGFYRNPVWPTSNARGECLLEVPLPPGTDSEIIIHPPGDLLPHRIATRSQATPECVFIVGRLTRGVRRRMRLVDKEGSNSSASLDLVGHCKEMQISGERVYLVDRARAYRVYGTGEGTSVMLDDAWRPPATDQVTRFEWKRVPATDYSSHGMDTLHVLDHTGTPIPKAECQLHLDGRERRALLSFGPWYTNADGALEHVTLDALALRISAPGQGTRYVDSRARIVRLPHAARLLVRFDMPGRIRPADWRLDIQTESWPRPETFRCIARSVDSVG